MVRRLALRVLLLELLDIRGGIIFLFAQVNSGCDSGFLEFRFLVKARLLGIFGELNDSIIDNIGIILEVLEF